MTFLMLVKCQEFSKGYVNALAQETLGYNHVDL